jgi:hypothetical protein
MIYGPVTLTKAEALICQGVLSQALMTTCRRLGDNVSATGDPLTDEDRYGLTRYSLEIQMVLMTFGETSEDLAKIVRDFSTPPKRKGKGKK